MLLKEYWFRELYLGLKVTASFDRSESYTRVIDGQVRCITRNQATEPAGHLERAVYHSVCAGMDDPSVYHSLRRESIKNASSASAIGVQSVRPTWFEDIAAPKDTTPQPNQDPQGQQPQPLHGLKLVIKEEVLPMKDQPEFPSLELLFFSVQRLHGFRQVVQHVWEHVAIRINWLIKSRKGHCCSGRKSKLVEDRYIVLCTVTLIKNPIAWTAGCQRPISTWHVEV